MPVVREGSSPMARLEPWPSSQEVGTSLTGITWRVGWEQRYTYARGADWRVPSGSEEVFVPVPGFWSITCGLAIPSTSQPDAGTFRLLIMISDEVRLANNSRLRASTMIQSVAIAGGVLYVEPGEPIRVSGGLNGGTASTVHAPLCWLGLELREGV